MQEGNKHHKSPVVVIGAGFTGLAAAYQLARQNMPVIVLEKDNEIGGLAGSFRINSQEIEKFYHHLFISDRCVIQLINELGCSSNLLCRPVKTAVYLDNKFFRLSTPLDVLRFKPLSLSDRIRLALLIPKAGRTKDYRDLENLSAEEWLIKLCGPTVYKIVWEPLLRGKFGPLAPEISAVWFWSKLMLRGCSRSPTGSEMLAYYRGGFAALAEKIAHGIKTVGGRIETAVSVNAIITSDGCVKGVQTSKGTIDAQAVIATPALPIIADLLKDSSLDEYAGALKKIRYLANICVVLELNHSLSDIYWLNVNDPQSPFVGIIEHTNFQPPEIYGGKHIIYLSKYLPQNDEMYNMGRERLIELAVAQLEGMFPNFSRYWICRCHLWKAPYAQPVVERNYSRLVPANRAPVKGLYIATMAQIYPEDRGINYAVREGRRIAQMAAEQTTTL